MSSTTAPANQTNKFRICVVGGGPAGAAVALGLRHQGHEVHIYEAYPLDATKKNSPNKAYVISLSKRGQDGLERATGIRPDQVTGGIVSGHMARHPAPLKLLPRGQNALIVPRQKLAAHILQKANEAGVHIQLEHRLVGIHFDCRMASFEKTTPEGGTTLVQQPYDLLIGADGSKSMVRTLLSMDHGVGQNFSVTRTEEDSMEYQVAILSETLLNTDTTMPEGTVHVWNSKRDNAVCLAFPISSDDQRSSTLFATIFPNGKLNEFKTAGYEDPLRSLLPDLSPDQRDALAQQLALGTPANGGTCVWCSSMGSPEAGVVLVGDAAHGMWPTLGQGANCALETAAVFCDTVQDVSRTLASSTSSADTAATEWSRKVVEEFNQRRHADAWAAVDLTYGGMGARESRGREVAPLAFKLQVAGMMILHKLTIGLVPMPALLRLMRGDNVTYSKARLYHFYYEKLICIAGLAFLIAPVLWWKRKATS